MKVISFLTSIELSLKTIFVKKYGMEAAIVLKKVVLLPKNMYNSKSLSWFLMEIMIWRIMEKVSHGIWIQCSSFARSWTHKVCTDMLQKKFAVAVQKIENTWRNKLLSNRNLTNEEISIIVFEYKNLDIFEPADVTKLFKLN